MTRWPGILVLAFAASGLSALTLEQELAYGKQRDAAVARRDFAEAIRLQKGIIEEPAIYVEVNIATELIEPGLFYWCDGSPSEARTAIRKAIQLMKTGKMLGNGCEVRAEQLLTRLNRVPRQLSLNEIAAILSFTMEAAQAEQSKKTNASIARSDARIRMFDAKAQTYRREGEFQASVAKFHASREYQTATGKTFDPNHRPYDGREREQWDACKRIYDIWGN